MFTDPTHHALNGPTMGTRWSVLLHPRPGCDLSALQVALQQAVTAVDTQMSTWNPDSDLMRLNAAPLQQWQTVPGELAAVLALGVAIGHASGGAFDMGLGAAVRAWGFGPAPADQDAICAALHAPRHPAHLALDIDGRRVRKTAPLTLDLNGIAKGYGVDRLAEVVAAHGITDALTAIDGELRATGLRADGQPWSVAIEAPDPARRAPHAMLALHDAAVATSGDYRHFVTLQGRRLAHTMDPARGAPLLDAPASVTVIAQTCAAADAWATALMVAGPQAGAALASRAGLDALFLLRDAAGKITTRGIGGLFAPPPAPAFSKEPPPCAP